MSVLFTPFRIGTLEVANRFVRSATGEGMCEPDGTVPPLLVDFYRTLAQGGTGLIITGHSFVRADGKASPGMMGVHGDEMLPGLRRLVAAVHETEARAVCQINHTPGNRIAKMFCNGVNAVGGAGAKCYFCTFLDQVVDDCIADPAGAARYENNFAFKTEIHLPPPP